MAIIGGTRPEEAKVFDSHMGYHEFHTEETQEPYGNFEVFWLDKDRDGNVIDSGWYWWSCYPGCMPDSNSKGPFATSRDAFQDADEWAPEFDVDFDPYDDAE